MKVIKENLKSSYPIDGTSNFILNCLSNFVSDKLVHDVRESLRGFDADMQLEIADNILNCAAQLSIGYTGIRHIDNLLWHLYQKVCKELGCPEEAKCPNYHKFYHK